MTHLALLAGTDFLTAEVLTLRGLVTHYVPFFIHLESRRVDIAGITVHPDERCEAYDIALYSLPSCFFGFVPGHLRFCCRQRHMPAGRDRAGAGGV